MNKHIHGPNDYGWGFQIGRTNGFFIIVISFGTFSYYWRRNEH